MPAPKSKAAAGKSTDGVTPPLGGSGAVCPALATRVSCAMAVGTRISIATRAAVTSKTNFFTRHPPFYLHVFYTPCITHHILPQFHPPHLSLASIRRIADKECSRKPPIAPLR